MSKFAVLLCAVLIATTAIAQRPKPGTFAWSSKLSSTQVVGNPTLDFLAPGNAFVPTSNNVFSFDYTGKLLWTFPIPSGQEGLTSVAAFEEVYVGALSQVYGLNRTTGALLWTYKVPAPRPNPKDNTIVTAWEGAVYVTSNNGPLVSLNGSTGAVRYTAGVGLAYNHVSVDRDQLFYNTNVDGKTYTVGANATTGATQWNISNTKNLMISRRNKLIYSMAVDSSNTYIWVNNYTAAAGGVYLFNITFPGASGVNYWINFEDTALFVSFQGIQSLSPTTGKVQWHNTTVKAGFILPTFFGVVNFGAGFVEELDGRDGSQRWLLSGPSAVNVGSNVPDERRGDSVVFGTATTVESIYV